jgi:hypothetical protein
MAGVPAAVRSAAESVVPGLFGRTFPGAKCGISHAKFR